MWVFNFSHPLTESQKQSIEALAGRRIENVVEIKCQLDHGRSSAEQVVEFVERVPLTPDQWQSVPLVICPPSLSAVACLVLAELHGRMGHFPPIVRLRPVAGQIPPAFEVAEIVNLQAIREEARRRR